MKVRFLLITGLLFPQLMALTTDAAVPWCGSTTRGLPKSGLQMGIAPGGCPIEGPPDIPANRDACIPGPDTPIQWLRMKITTFAWDDGSEPLLTQEDMDGQMQTLNEHFLPWRIQFVYESEIINDGRYVFVDNSGGGYDAFFEMMDANADQPDRQLNVFVTLVGDFNLLAGFASFPWDPWALQGRGGIWVHAGVFGAGGSTLTHEVGHALGLYHTFAGVNEVEACSECYERADGLGGDTTGDLCSDTQPTPASFECGPYEGVDPCSNTPWPPGGFHNHMSYTGCRSEFTPQQAGRMHCWVRERLSGWTLFNLTVSMSASPEPAIVGSNLTYSLVISNHGAAMFSPVVLSNVFPEGVCFASATPNLNYIQSGNALALVIDPLASQEVITGTIEVIPTLAGTITNLLNFPAPGIVDGQSTNRVGTVTSVQSNALVSSSVLVIGDTAIREGNSGTREATFHVCLSPPATQVTQILYATADGTAVQGSDYLSTNGVLTFEPGETSKTIVVQVIGETLRESNETFYVNLQPATNSFNARLQGVATIVRDDFFIDLSITQVNGPAAVPAGNDILITNTIQNLETETVKDSFRIGLYLSSDSTITTNDLRIAIRPAGPLTGGQADTAITFATIGPEVPPGMYFLGAIADELDTINEVDESNNALAGNPIIISAGPDLVLTAVSGPSLAGIATSITVSNSVANLGDGRSGAFDLAFYLSTDSVVTTNDLKLGFRTISGLAPGQTNSEFTSVVIPVNAHIGHYTLGVIADATGVVIEKSESNNSLAGQTIEIVDGPDLIVTLVAGPSSAPSGGPVLVTNTIQNFGKTAITPRFTVGVYLSVDQVIDTNDLLIYAREINGLGGGACSVDIATIDLSAFQITGRYFLGAIADQFVSALEVNEDNNALVGNAIEIVVGPDLVITGLSGPSIRGTAELMNITNAVSNVGLGNPGTFGIGYYLSSDAIITTNDVRIGGRTVNGLGAGQSSVATTSLQLRTDLTPGTYYLGAIVDETGSVLEVDKANNAFTGPLINIVIGPDLIVSALSGPTQLSTGGSLIISNTIQNVGMRDVLVSIQVGFYLSEDATITTGDRLLTTRTVPGTLAAGQSHSAQTVVSYLPEQIQPGTYYLGALVDTFFEHSKTNNSSAFAVEVVVGPDLVVGAISGPDRAGTSGSFYVTNSVQNIGTGDALQASVGFYLSTDQIITTNDVLIGSRMVTPLPQGQTTNAATLVNFSPDVPLGFYYLGAVVDYAGMLAEADEDNNVLLGNAIEIVVGADLVITGLSGPTIRGTAELMNITNTVSNVGLGNPGTFGVGYYLSADATVSTNDVRIGGRIVNGLGAGQSSMATTSLQLGTDLIPGTYYLGAIVDETGSVLEVDKANNAFTGPLINIVIGPDLIMSALSGPAQLSTGGPLTISNTVQNVGMRDIFVASQVAFYLSEDATITTGDRLLTIRTPPALAAGQSHTAHTVVNLPEQLQPGAYYIGALCDTFFEHSKTNNTLAFPVDVVLGPDLVVGALSGPDRAGTGGSFYITNTVQNIGTGDALQASVGFYLSTDQIITTNDVLIGSRPVTPLPRGQSTNAVTLVNLSPDAALGSYYLGAVVDYTGMLTEADENNNVLLGNAIEIVVGPDLVITTLIGPALGGTTEQMLITNRVSNVGLGNSGTFGIGVYLSTDATITTNDIRIGGRTVNGLGVAQTNFGIIPVQLSVDLIPGIYYLGAIADEAGSILEIDKSNNAFTGPLINVLIGPDLIVSALSAPAQLTTGASFVISNTVQNVGMRNITAGGIGVGFYLSEDTLITTNDWLIARRTIGDGLPGGQSSTANTVVADCAVPPRTYYLGAIVDYTGELIEAVETNNTFQANAIEIASTQITTVQKNGPGATITFTSVPGRIYRVERASDLRGPWTEVVRVSAIGSLTTASDPDDLFHLTVYYRVRELY